MIHDKWFISDTHFFHGNILRFKDDAGKYIRSEFVSLEQMHETMIDNWNKLVKDHDYVYHLGDVTFRYDGAFNALMHRLKGKKRLIVGNHDKLKNPALHANFEKIELWKGFTEKEAGIAFTASHFPMPEYSLRNGKHNAHGHIHKGKSRESHQFNLSVENINYTPMHIDELVAKFKRA